MARKKVRYWPNQQSVSLFFCNYAVALAVTHACKPCVELDKRQTVHLGAERNTKQRMICMTQQGFVPQTIPLYIVHSRRAPITLLLLLLNYCTLWRDRAIFHHHHHSYYHIIRNEWLMPKFHPLDGGAWGCIRLYLCGVSDFAWHLTSSYIRQHQQLETHTHAYLSMKITTILQFYYVHSCSVVFVCSRVGNSQPA